MYDAPEGYKVEQPVQLKPGASVEALRILLPDGSEQDIALDEYGATFLDTQQLGIYTITALPGEYTEQFAVNAFSDLESGIAPQQEVSVVKQDEEGSGQNLQQMGLRNLWQFPVVLALVLLIVEWGLYFRRPMPLWIQNRIPILRRRNTH